ncbi:hypothetical protein HZA71_00635 [Candidatus Falkowbacteria bacterium]|nr:hypothetical protein [Candidatus Falkowbacteria bacterium]
MKTEKIKLTGIFRLAGKVCGQGLLELIIAIGVITVGMFGVWTLFLSNFSGEKEASTRIVASNLAREGIEIVKNIRDTNWLRAEVNDKTCVLNSNEVCQWNDGLGDGNYVPDNIFTAAKEYLKLLPVGDATIDDPTTKLNINDTGFYVHQTGAPTPYRRLITISSICCADASAVLVCDTNDFGDCDPGRNMKIGINVKSHVRWEINNQPRNIVVADQIYNWK